MVDAVVDSSGRCTNNNAISEQMSSSGYRKEYCSLCPVITSKNAGL
jgi:hypothetical protein